MELLIKKLKSSVVYGIALFTLAGSLVMTSCGGRDYDTQSDRNFDNEETLPQSSTGDTSSVGVRADSTPAANPDLDDNPIIDKGMSSDSAMRDNSNIKE